MKKVKEQYNYSEGDASVTEAVESILAAEERARTLLEESEKSAAAITLNCTEKIQREQEELEERVKVQRKNTIDARLAQAEEIAKSRAQKAESEAETLLAKKSKEVEAIANSLVKQLKAGTLCR